MQTFLPYPSFSASASILDMRRLGKQRVEAKQILLSLTGESRGWRNHPAVRMWAGYEPALALYGVSVCREWKSRGYRDSLLPMFEEFVATKFDGRLPRWLGDEAFHASHRSNLLRKNPSWYTRFGWIEPETLAYVWPGGAS